MSPKAKYLLGTIGFCLLAAGGRAHAERSAGKKIYDKWCSDCHSTQTGPGSMALQRKYHGDPPAILQQRHDLTPDYVSLAVRHGVSFMPSFRKTEISDADLALLGAYLAPPQEPPSQPKQQP
jgi:mono/diheme cytochrome c family protein